MDASRKQEQRDAWKEAASVNLARIDSLGTASERVDLLMETAVILEKQLDDPGEAFSAVLRAFWEIPTRQPTIRDLERLADLTGRWPEVHDTAATALGKTPGKTAQIALLLQTAKWCASKLDRPDLAVGYCSQVLQIDPTNIDAYKSLADLYGTSQQWNDLAAALEAAASTCTDPGETKRFLFVRGRVLEQHVGDLDAAVTSYERACEFDPGYGDALDALDKIHTEGKRWWPLLTVINRKIAAATQDAERIGLLMRKGELLATAVESVEEAVDAYNDVLRLDGRHLPALEALEAAHRALGQPNKVRDLLDQQLAAAPGDAKRLEILMRLATVLEEPLWELDRAAASWEKVLELAPGDRNALDSLIRIYRQRQQAEPLARTLRQAIRFRGEEPSVRALHLELGQVLAEDLGREEEAEQAFRALLQLEPDHVEALDGLARVLESSGKSAEAEAILLRLSELTKDEAQRAEIDFRLGSLVAARKDDPQRAIACLARVRKVNPEHLLALQALHELYLEVEAWDDAAEVIGVEYSLEESPNKKAALGSELGALCRRQGKEEPARLWFERALAIDPLNAAAARAIAAIHLAEGKPDQAAPLLEMLVRTGAMTEEADQRELLVKLARVHKQLGATDKAIEDVQKAHEIDPSRFDTLRALGEELFRAERWEEARPIYLQLTDPKREEVDAADRARLLYEQAVILRHLGQQKGAVDSLEKALSEAPGHADSLRLLIRLHLDEQKYRDALGCLRQLADHAGEEQRPDILIEIGDLAGEKIGDRTEAMEAYEEAILARPEDRAAMHKLLAQYQATEQWPKVVDIIWRLLEVETDDRWSARLYKTMGIIYRDKLDQAARSIECFNAALEADPEDREIFAAVEKSLRKAADWEALVGCYRKLLSRVEGQGMRDREAELWHSLGRLYFDDLKDQASAADAFEKAVALDPDNADRQELLAACYFDLPDRSEDAVAAYRRLVLTRPDNAFYYQCLGSLLAQKKRNDEIWNVCAALVALGKANDRERTFYEGRHARDPKEAKGSVTREQWDRSIAHRDDDPAIAALFARVTAVIIARMDQPLKAYGLKGRNRVSPGDDNPVARIYYTAGQLLGPSPLPELYIKPQDPSPFSFTLTDPVRSVVGETYVKTRSPSELRFAAAEHMAYCRPGRSIRWLVANTGELGLYLVAAIKLCIPEFEPPGVDGALLRSCVDALGPSLSPQAIDEMREPAAQIVARSKAPLLPRWIAGIEHTACRAALVLLGDLPETVQMVKTQQQGAGVPPVSEKLSDLLAYAVSREYADLRDALGLVAQKPGI